MKKILALLLMGVFIASNCWGADINDWKRGDASIPVKGTDVISDADILISNYIVDPLDRLLTNYRTGCQLSYTSATTVTIQAGEIVLSNAGGTVRRFRQNTSTTIVDLTVSGAGGLDTGAEANSTTYYVFAVADADATTFTAVCSTSATTPTGFTYYRYIGNFYNNSSGNISSMSVENNLGETGLGDWSTTDIDGTTLAVDTVYQARTDGFVMAATTAAALNASTDSSNPPTTIRDYANGSNKGGISMMVRKNDYWKVAVEIGSGTTVYWIPIKHLTK